MLALIKWLTYGTCITINQRQIVGQPRMRTEGWAKVMSIHVNGGLRLDMQPEDMTRLGIRHGDSFLLKVIPQRPSLPRQSTGPPKTPLVLANSTTSPAAGEGQEAKEVRVTYTHGAFHHTNIARGDCCAFDDASGSLAVVRNDVVGTSQPLPVDLGVEVHDFVHLRKAPKRQVGKLTTSGLRFDLPFGARRAGGSTLEFRPSAVGKQSTGSEEKLEEKS